VQRTLKRFRYKVLGEAVLLKLGPEDDIGEALSFVESRHPRARWVLAYEGVWGPLRKPRVRLLKGEEPVVTVYREGGVEYEIDAANLMLSLGNKFERFRMAATVRSWETVVDMFAGVGQFTLPIAVHARPVKVHSIELDREAYMFLVRNARRNRVEEVVVPHLGDCREVTAELGQVADRVIMGYFGGTLEYLPHALSVLRPGGGVIHVHEVVRSEELEAFARQVVKRAEELGYRAVPVWIRTVKTYSPDEVHVVVDVLTVRSRRR
jgi:tRNA wybutosine-synthesizing protein 2